jgi:hypothetical protein
MANEEKAHLKSLGDLLDKNMDFKWNTTSTIFDTWKNSK